MGTAVSAFECSGVGILFRVTVLCSYICCLLVKKAGCMGAVGSSEDNSDSEDGDGEAGSAES
jgi:hypothetical protein